ncbi:MAG: valine--tRNA ligase [Planctomycetaceae bacterium]|nr:valine--tRNA ligase [Planctomycetaceae bacterium]
MPKQYDPHAAQEKWSKFWDENELFLPQSGRGKSPERGAVPRSCGNKPFCVVIPPPNVTGALHLGHALNNTLQDIAVRMKRMQGYDTLWIPGVDHAGIATQAVVERKLFEEEKLTRHDIGREALVQRIWNWKDQYQARIISQLKGMGCSCDWSRTRFTLDPVCAKAVRHFFFKLFREKKIYRGKRLVNWDTHLQTAVSDDEVFHETVKGAFYYIKYQFVNSDDYVVVATTRPETLLGDTAVAVHPDPEAALTVADNAVPDTPLERLKTLAGCAKQGVKVVLPLLNREIPLIADVWAKPEKGTGCVKITPAHDPNDYEVGKRNGLPMVNILNKDGTLNENAGVYQGLTVKQARVKVVADLEAAGLLVKIEEREIEEPHSDRSKTPIEPFLNDQWFVKMDELAQEAIDAVVGGGTCSGEKVRIFPERYTKGYIDWLSEKRDWPIGRQLWWGHRIPIWYFPAADYESSFNALKAAFVKRPDIDFQYDAESAAWRICSQTEDLKEDVIPGYKITQEEDVLDTWFSSALWPLSTLKYFEDDKSDYKRYYPTSVLITSRDILTLWVARMVLAGKSNTGKIPFREVFIHPKILDKYGEGMSKSKGNGIDPLSVINKFGADALRFAMAFLTTDSQDIRLPLDFECPHCGAVVEQTKKNRTLPRVQCPKCKKDFKTQWASKDEDAALPEGVVVGERFEVARNFCNKLWNAARFVLMNLTDVSVGTCPGRAEQVPPRTTYLEDKWILSRLATVTKTVTDNLEHYHYADAMRELYDFAWDEFCSFYVEMVKTRLYAVSGGDLSPNSAQVMLVHILSNLIRLLHPVIPFVTEEIYQRMLAVGVAPAAAEQVPSLAVALFPVADETAIDAEVEKQFAVFQELLRAIRDVRASRNIPPKTEISFRIKCDDTTVKLLEPLKPYFASMARAQLVRVGNCSGGGLTATVPLTGMDLFVDLSNLIDVPAEITKLEKELEKLDGLIESRNRKIADESFIAKAPAAVVAKERDALASLQQQRTSATEALAKLKGV